MIPRRIAFLLGTSIVFSGCATMAPMTAGCGDVVAKKVTINYKKNNSINVSPPTRDVEQGEAIRFVFKGDAGADVKIDGATAQDAWIKSDGKGSPSGNSYYLCVNVNQTARDYKYNIEVVGVGTLDPVVRVKTRGGGR